MGREIVCRFLLIFGGTIFALGGLSSVSLVMGIVSERMISGPLADLGYLAALGVNSLIVLFVPRKHRVLLGSASIGFALQMISMSLALKFQLPIGGLNPLVMLMVGLSILSLAFLDQPLEEEIED